MNDRLIEILTERPDFTLSSEDQRLLKIFAEYLDRGSLFLFGYEPGKTVADDPAFVFTNEAQRFRFTISQIRDYVHQLKQGQPIDWERMPFEYINRPD